MRASFGAKGSALTSAHSGYALWSGKSTERTLSLEYGLVNKVFLSIDTRRHET